jgi:hypothetical protein
MTFRNKLISYGEELLAPRPTPQVGELFTVGCLRLLIQYILSYPPYLVAVSSIRNRRMRHGVVTRDPLNTETYIRNFRNLIVKS